VESFKRKKKGKNNDLCFNFYEKGPFNIHLKVKRPNTPLVVRKREKMLSQFVIFNAMAKSKISFQSIRQYAWFIWEVTFSEEIEANTVLDSPIQNEGLTAYILRYMVVNKGVIKDVPEDMELASMMQQLNSDHNNKHPILFQIIVAVRLKMRVKETNEETKEKDGCGKSRGQYV
jgi:hypothetical protein